VTKAVTSGCIWGCAHADGTVTATDVVGRASWVVGLVGGGEVTALALSAGDEGGGEVAVAVARRMEGQLRTDLYHLCKRLVRHGMSTQAKADLLK